MFLDHVAERDRHRFLEHRRFLDMTGHLEQFRPVIAFAAKAGEPARAAPHDRRNHCDALDIVHRRRAAIETGPRRERRFQPRLALLALEALDHRGFLAADIGAGAAMDEDVEIIAGFRGILADQPRVIGFLDGGLHDLGFHDIFAADIDIGGARAHRETGDQGALNQLVRIVAQDFAVLAAARLGFVGIDHQKARARIALTVLRRLLGHERPFETGRETRAAAPAQAAGLHLLDDPVIAELDDIGGLVPVAALLRRLQVP